MFDGSVCCFSVVTAVYRIHTALQISIATIFTRSGYSVQLLFLRPYDGRVSTVSELNWQFKIAQ